MTGLRFDPPLWSDVELETDTVLGGPRGLDAATDTPSSGDAPILGRRVSVGRTQVRPLTAHDPVITPDMRAFTASTNDRFYALRLACSIDGGQDETLLAASLAVDLGADAVAWSLAPLRLNATTTAPSYSLGAEVSLSPLLKISGTWAPPSEQERCWIYALGELERDPEWRLHAGRGVAITGPQVFDMIVRVPPGPASTATVTIGAQLQRKGFIVRGRVETPTGTGSFLLA